MIISGAVFASQIARIFPTDESLDRLYLSASVTPIVGIDIASLTNRGNSSNSPSIQSGITSSGKYCDRPLGQI